jgi:HD-GYP domain-containing protein (c-di-GMP phosphodiesterase class II)
MHSFDAPPRIVLSGHDHRLSERRWEASTVLRIGRGNEVQIVLDDPSVSTQHAEVRATNRGWTIRDLGSAQGTYLNGIPLTREQKIQIDDVIHCGSEALRVTELAEPSHRPAETPRSNEVGVKTAGKMKIQAATQRSWEQGLQELSAGTARPHHGKHLFTLLRAGYHLSRVGSLLEMLESVLNDTVTVLAAQQGAILLEDEATGELSPFAFSFSGKTDAMRSVSMTLAMRCFARGESLLCKDITGSETENQSASLAEGHMGSLICALMRSPRQRLGVLHLHRGPMQEPFSEEDLYLADAVAASVSVGMECAQIIEKQREPFFSKITAFVSRAIELRDPHTGKHSDRVQKYSMMLAERIGLPKEECQRLRIGAGLHDLGKIVIGDAILQKPGRLSAVELEKMRQATLKGVALAETFPDLAPFSPIIRSHHERWDGKGYPDGLNGENIPQLARIVTIANAFDTMTVDQPYRTAMLLDEALAELMAGAGTQFDPSLVGEFVKLRPQLEHFLHAGKADSGSFLDQLPC